MAYKFQHGQAILSGALDQEGSIDIKNDGSGEFELKHDGNTILNSSRALGNVTSISGSTSISGRDLVLDVGGKIGISTDLGTNVQLNSPAIFISAKEKTKTKSTMTFYVANFYQVIFFTIISYMMN